MNGGDIFLALIVLIYGPLIVYPLLGIPFMAGLIAWLLLQGATGAVCQLVGWRRPGWAIPHTERPKRGIPWPTPKG